jgi:hypothetical protein
VLGLLFGSIALLAKLLGKSLPTEPGDAAAKTVELNKKLYATEYEYRVASPYDFPTSNHAYYNETQAWLESQGFRLLADYELLTATRAMPSMRTFLRFMLSNDGTTMAAIYDIRPRGWMRLAQSVGVISRDFRTLELETEFEDQTFLATSNGVEAGSVREVPGITRRFVQRQYGPDAVLAAHHEGLAAMAKPPRIQRTPQDVIDSQTRQHQLKAADRARSGYVTVEEIERVAGGKLSTRQRQYAEEAERLGRAPQAPPPLPPRRPD